MIVKQPPCVECLIYAMCKNKRVIKCDSLVDYYQYLTDNVFRICNNNYSVGYPVWDYILKFLPTLEVIKSEDVLLFRFTNYRTSC